LLIYNACEILTAPFGLTNENGIDDNSYNNSLHNCTSPPFQYLHGSIQLIRTKQLIQSVFWCLLFGSHGKWAQYSWLWSEGKKSRTNNCFTYGLLLIQFEGQMLHVVTNSHLSNNFCNYCTQAGFQLDYVGIIVSLTLFNCSSVATKELFNLHTRKNHLPYCNDGFPFYNFFFF
jgi:hypothetical protein